MPYIPQAVREDINLTHGQGPIDSGELTYVLYKACLRYVGNEYRYRQLAEVLGALEATKQEFYRRIVAPYEDRKITQNGDVTP